MDKNGNLFGETDFRNLETVFLESLHNLYNNYLSLKHTDWYIGVKKSGTIKPGPRTRYGQKAIQFLPVRGEVA